MNIQLNLLDYRSNLKIKKEENKRYLFDPIRKTYLVLTPEEMVRQLLILYLISERNISKNRLALEKALKVNKMTRRWDLMVYAQDMTPWLLVECKAPEVKITQSVFEQISAYNLTLRVPYLLVTNGIETYCCEMDYEGETFRFLEAVPELVDQ